MKIQSTRFGELDVGADEAIEFPEGILGFDKLRRFCLVDSGDDTLILWLQSLESPEIAFPVLEPRFFKNDYVVRLSAQELRLLKLENVNQSVVFNILTIPNDVVQMTANVKAPIVINLKDQLGKQVVLQESEYTLKQLMFKELKSHLVTIASNRAASDQASDKVATIVPINLRQIVPSSFVKAL